MKWNARLGRLCCVLCPEHQFNSARNTILIRHERFNKKPANLLCYFFRLSGILIQLFIFSVCLSSFYLFIYLLLFQLPGKKYAQGYNADVGDKYIWLK